MKLVDLLRLTARKLREPMGIVRRNGVSRPEDAPAEVREHVELAAEAVEIAERIEDFSRRAGALLGRG